MQMSIDKKQCKSDKIFDIVVVSIIVFAFIATAYPIYFVIIASVSDPAHVAQGQVLFFPSGFSLKAYEFILNEASIWSGYANTILYTVAGTFLGTMATILVAYSLSRKDFIGRNVMMKIIIFTMFFHGGLIPTYLTIDGLNLLNTRLILIIMGAVVAYNIAIAKTYFENTIPTELLEACQIDGCGNTRFFVSIVLPLSKSIIAIIALYIGVTYWNGYFNALVYVTDKDLFPLQLILRQILIQGQSLTTSVDPSELDAIAEMRFKRLNNILP